MKKFLKKYFIENAFSKLLRLSVVAMACIFSSINANAFCPTAVATGSAFVSCFGSANGSASVNVTGGSGQYSIRWSNGANNVTSINFLTAGIYYVNVTDLVSGCTVFDLVVINEPEPLEVDFIIRDVNCRNQSTGRIQPNVSGGTSPYTYTWSNGATTAVLNNIVAGNYNVTIRDSRNCQVVRTVTVQQPASEVQAVTSVTNVSCAGNFDGAVDLTVWGGTPPYNYNWNSGTYVTEDLENIPAGNYSVQITDERGCILTRNATVIQPPPVNTTFTKTDVSCFDGTNGSINISVSGGAPPYTYRWADTQFALSFTTGNISGLKAETYRVTVTDSRGCTGFRTVTVTQPLAPLTATFVKTDINCFGGSDGSITVTPAGGTSPYSYAWSSGQTTAAINNLTLGNYTFTITDSKGCTFSETVQIFQPLAPLSLGFTIKNVSCFLGSDGEVAALVAGGTTPYNYNWNNGLYFTPTIANITAGNYAVVVTDVNGCTITDGVIVTQPTQVIVIDTITNVDCYGNATGVVDLTVSGGVAPYKYNWSSTRFLLNVATEDVNGLIADKYYYRVTDFNGCIVEDSAIVEQPDSIVIAMVVADVLCFGGNDGSITVTVTGGVLPYRFQWANSLGPISDTTQNITNKPAETYTILVTDDNACTATNTAVIKQPDAPLTSTLTGTDVNCYGGNDGTADLTVSGGTPPYSYFWTNGTNTQDQFTLFAGTYDVLVVDFNGCETQNSITINQPAAPITSNFVITNVRCFGESNGIADLSVAGGTPPYRYSWVNSDFVLSVTVQDLINFPADTFTVTITDTNNCVLLDTAIITQPPLLEIALVGTNVKCHGENTGAIDLTIVGGTPPYAVQWSNGSVTEDLQDLFNGEYAVTVTDANNCIVIDTILITQPDRPLSAVSETVNATCFGENDGRLLIVVDGGTSPYNYLWSTGGTTRIIEELLAGFYVVTVTDTNACVLIDSFEVTQPDKIEIIPTITDVSCYGFSDGDVELEILGGTPPFRYKWTNSLFQISVITRDLTDIPTDTYTIEIVDSNGCFATATFFVPQPDTLLANADVKGVRCHNDVDGSITLAPTGGNPDYSFIWSTGDTINALTNLIPGFYSLTLTDTKNCIVIDTFEIINPDPITLKVFIKPNSCIDLNDGSITIEPSGGYGSWQYIWSNGSVDNPLTGVPKDTFYVTVSDLLSCTKDTFAYLPTIPRECVEIPNAFTPNGDGKNDTWQMRDIDIYPNCILRVFNKLGVLVFESNRGYTELWDGTYNGKALPSDTYYYVLDLDNGRKPKSGDITIVR
jgi:gliding motility-associated-like protein